MSRCMKGLILCLSVSVFLYLICPKATAQLSYGFPALWNYCPFHTGICPSYQSSQFEWLRGDIIVDNFEYWDSSPLNHGWEAEGPIIQPLSFCWNGSPGITTDLQIASRVLDVYPPASGFLPRPDAKIELWRNLFTPSIYDDDPSFGLDYIEMDSHGVISFDLKLPIDSKPEENFEMDVEGLTASGYHVTARILPEDSDDGDLLKKPLVTDFSETSLEVTVGLPGSYSDGSWHEVWVDLKDSVKKAVDGFEGIAEKEAWYMSSAQRILLSGRMFRLDNIAFRSGFRRGIRYRPYLFDTGPLYVQIFEPYTFIFVADYTGAHIKSRVNGKTREYDSVPDLMLDPENFLFAQDPNDPNDPVYRYYVNELGADPNLFGENDPNVAQTLRLPFFIVDFSLPIFADPNLRFGGSQIDYIKGTATLGWGGTLHDYDGNGIWCFLVEPLSTVPYDGMPTYLPARHTVSNLIKRYGRPYYSPEQVYMLEAALWNAGVSVWPNVATLGYTPQYFDDMILTLEVTEGVNSDVRTIPISVVNSPVENYAPVAQLPIEDAVFYIGEKGESFINFIDPDCFIFSQTYNLNGKIPNTTHVPSNIPGMSIRDDMSCLQWSMTINGLPSYIDGPWLNNLIDQNSGLISFFPIHDGIYEAVVTCSDNHGGKGFGEATIAFAHPYGKDSGQSLVNNSPIIKSAPENIVFLRAGEEVTLSPPDIEVYDPDGNKLFASSNVGDIQRITGDDFMWRFQSHFPGLYRVQIVFYDNRGGSVTMTFSVDVNPWWSY
jgi:hypothetical protein